MLNLSILLLGALPLAQAKDCPSKLPSHLTEVTDWLELGAELRTITVGMVAGDDLATPPPEVGSFDLAFMSGLRGAAYVYPTDFLTVVLEPEVRYKNPGWDDKNISGLWPMRINQALLELDVGRTTLDLGIQNLAWGTGALLDTRAIGLYGEYSSKSLSFSAFAAVTRYDMMSNATSCLWYRYVAARNDWKVISASPNENLIAGGAFSVKAWKPWKLKGMLYTTRLTGDTPEIDEELDGTFASLSFGGPIVERHLSFTLEPVAALQGDTVRAGAVGMLRATPFEGKHAPRGRVGFAATFTDDLLAPAWEGLSWGYLRRYSIHDGQLATFRFKLPARDWLQVQVDYQAQFDEIADGPAGDELDVGVQLVAAELYHFTFSLAGLDLTGSQEPSLGGFFEMRLIAGAR